MKNKVKCPTCGCSVPAEWLADERDEAVARLVEAAKGALVVMEVFKANATAGFAELKAALAAFDERG